VVRHKCENPGCVNPDHLEVGTHADNVRDSFERRLAPWHTKDFELNLTFAKIADIRDNPKGLTELQTCVRHGVHVETVRRIREHYRTPAIELTAPTR
jgi:hypothetical protein